MAIINPPKEFWQSRRLNQRPPTLKSCTPRSDLQGIDITYPNTALEFDQRIIWGLASATPLDGVEGFHKVIYIKSIAIQYPNIALH